MKLFAGDPVTLVNPKTDEQQQARVVYLGPRQSEKQEVGIEFVKPSPLFWRIAFPPGDWTPDRSQHHRPHSPTSPECISLSASSAEILADIPLGCSAQLPEHSRKVLLCFEAASHGDIQDSYVGRPQHLLCAFHSMVQDKLVRAFPGRLAKRVRKMCRAQPHRFR